MRKSSFPPHPFIYIAVWVLLLVGLYLSSLYSYLLFHGIAEIFSVIIAGGVFALALFGIPARDAAGFTLANHAVQMFPVMLMGLASVMATSINIWQLSYDREVSGK